MITGDTSSPEISLVNHRNEPISSNVAYNNILLTSPNTPPTGDADKRRPGPLTEEEAQLVKYFFTVLVSWVSEVA